MKKNYTIKELILACREEYLKQLVELEKMNELVIPLSHKSDRVRFELAGSVIYSDIVCNVIKKITFLDKLLNRTDERILSTYSESSCGAIPYFIKDVSKFDKIKDGIRESDYFNGMSKVSQFKSGVNNYLLQTSVGDIRVTRRATKTSPAAGFYFTEGKFFTLDNNTEIADLYNILNAELPESAMTEYQKQIVDKVEDPFALRIVDVRKADEVKSDKGVIVLARRK